MFVDPGLETSADPDDATRRSDEVTKEPRDDDKSAKAETDKSACDGTDEATQKSQKDDTKKSAEIIARKSAEEISQKSADCSSSSSAKMLVIKNAWRNTPDQAFPSALNMDECPPLRGYTEGSIKPILRTRPVNLDGFIGWDVCDVPGCFCKSVKTTPPEASPSETPATGTHSGNITPKSSRKNKKKIAKDLMRVKRALKTLGVNIIEYEVQDSDDAQCTRDYCKFGCVCDSIKMKPIAPTHCGKVECMFDCSCSSEALKFSSCGNRRVNISAAVGARIQESSQRFMAAEERKFTNTVLLTSTRRV